MDIKAHDLAKTYYVQNEQTALEELKKVEVEVDCLVAQLCGITGEELKEIKRTLKILKEGQFDEEEIKDIVEE